jgi:cobalt-zinc-cadmium efflux system membrane fusion protein
MLARVELPNPDGRWRPGFFVVGEIIVEEATVPLAVKASALQTFRDWDVVFIRDGNVFEIATLELGRRDNEWVEVVSGLSAGERYVSKNSFILKADVGKSGATHDH